MLLVLEGRVLANTIDLILRHGVYVRRFEVAVKAARVAIADWKPHLLLLDIDLEDGSGIELINEARAGGPIGVIALTRRSDLRGKLDAFERGADDYIGVPFVPDDLIARTRAVLLRTQGYKSEFVPRQRIGELEIDVLSRTVLVRRREVHLTSLEQALLYLLAANDGVVLTREEILDALWGTDYVSASNVVDWHVRGLRAKLEHDTRTPRYIETVPRTGYRFVSGPRGPASRPVSSGR